MKFKKKINDENLTESIEQKYQISDSNFEFQKVIFAV